MQLTEQDITSWNGIRFSDSSSFGIEKLNEKLYSEDALLNLECFINDSGQGFSADGFNVEYMGFLIGKFSGTKGELIEMINDCLKDEPYKDLDAKVIDQHTDQAIHQLIGFVQALNNPCVISLVESMGLTKDEWIIIKQDPMMSNTSSMDIKNDIDDYFNKKY